MTFHCRIDYMIPCNAVASHAACPSQPPSCHHHQCSWCPPCFFSPSTLSADISQCLQHFPGAPFALFIACAASNMACPPIIISMLFSTILMSSWFVSSTNLLSRCSQWFPLTPTAFYNGPLPMHFSGPTLSSATWQKIWGFEKFWTSEKNLTPDLLIWNFWKVLKSCDFRKISDTQNLSEPQNLSQMFSDVQIFGQIFSDVEIFSQTFSDGQIFCQVADVASCHWCCLLLLIFTDLVDIRCTQWISMASYIQLVHFFYQPPQQMLMMIPAYSSCFLQWSIAHTSPGPCSLHFTTTAAATPCYYGGYKVHSIDFYVVLDTLTRATFYNAPVPHVAAELQCFIPPCHSAS